MSSKKKRSVASKKRSVASGKNALTEIKPSAVINKRLATVLYILLGVVTLALLVMTILASAGYSSVWHPMPIAIVLGLLGVAIAVSIVAFNPRKTVYSIGFYLLHFGIVIFLIGTMVYAISGSVHYVAAPNVGSITNTMEYQMTSQYGWTEDELASLKGYHNQIGNSENDEIVDLGFNFRITDFVTEYYEDGESVKHYEATVEFYNTDGSTEQVSLTVNHPIYRNGWKIYLMDIGVHELYGYQRVQLMIKDDPTEFLSVAGILLIIIGTFMMCFIRPREGAVNRKQTGKSVKALPVNRKQGGEAR